MNIRPASSTITTVVASLLLAVAQLAITRVEGDPRSGMLVLLGGCAIGLGLVAQKRWAWGLALVLACHSVAWAWSWWSWESPGSEMFVNVSLAAVAAILVTSLLFCPVVGGKGAALGSACGALTIAIGVVAARGALLPAYSSVFFANAPDWWSRTYFQSRLTGARSVLLAWVCYLIVVTVGRVVLRARRRA